MAMALLSRAQRREYADMLGSIRMARRVRAGVAVVDPGGAVVASTAPGGRVAGGRGRGGERGGRGGVGGAADGAAGAVVGAGGSGGFNSRVYVNPDWERLERDACRPVRMVPTADLSDRAHGVRDVDGYLVPARRVGVMVRGRAIGSARPRMYPECQMRGGGGVAPDSSFDALYEAQRRLEGVPGIGIQDCRATMLDLRGGRL